jgi:hypothetical protein
MFKTMKQMAVNVGLSNDEVTTYGFSAAGLVVVNTKDMQDLMVSRGYPMHSAFGKKFFFCFLTRVY